eukprot:6565882-Ditylum_brightwellii.AAC.1
MEKCYESHLVDGIIQEIGLKDHGQRNPLDPSTFDHGQEVSWTPSEEASPVIFYTRWCNDMARHALVWNNRGGCTKATRWVAVIPQK